MCDQHVIAIATVAQAVILIITAVLIYRYFRSTQHLVEAARKQLEAQIRPALTVVCRDTRLWIVNIGSGTALNVLLLRKRPLSAPNGADFGVSLKGSFVAVGESQAKDTGELVGSIGTLRDEVLELTYESLSGNAYTSVIKFEGNGHPCEVLLFPKQ